MPTAISDLGDAPVDGEFDPDEADESDGASKDEASEEDAGEDDAGEDDAIEDTVAIVDSATAPVDRDQWPLLEHLLPVQDPESLHRRAEVTAGHYLSRKAPRAERT